MGGTRWSSERSEAAVRLRPWRFITLPWRDRAFLHDRYERLIRGLAEDSRFQVVRLKDLGQEASDRITVGLRHDVDDRLPSAFDLARIEQRYGIPATYFVLHTASYYGKLDRGRAIHDERLVPALHELQALGHEVGWHNDLVTIQCVYDIEPREYLRRELDWLRTNGVDIVGCAAHGSYWCHRLRFHNDYFFSELDDPRPGFPNSRVVSVDGRSIELSKGTHEEFGFEYDTAALDLTHYFSDGLYAADGSRWHTDELDLDAFEPGDRVVLATHPNHWDPWLGAKVVHNVKRGADRLIRRRRA